MKIAHLTDVHFGAVDDAVVASLLADLEAQAPDVVAVTGDLTQSATREEFEQAREFLSRIGGTRLIVPGNHDTPARNPLARLLNPWQRYREYVGPTEPRRVIQDVAFAGINSARRARPGWNWSLGAVSRGQIRHAVDYLTAADAHCRIVAIHHPLVALGGAENQRAMAGGRRLLESLIDAGVELVLCGHSHRQLSFEVKSHVPPLRRLLVLQSSTATSSRRRGEPNGYTVVTVQREEITAEARVSRNGGFEAVGLERWSRRLGDGRKDSWLR